MASPLLHRVAMTRLYTGLAQCIVKLGIWT